MDPLIQGGQGRDSNATLFSGMLVVGALTGLGTVLFALALVRLAFWIAG